MGAQQITPSLSLPKFAKFAVNGQVGAQQIATLGAERERLQQRLAALEQATLH